MQLSNDFNDEQNKKLEELFEKFYDLSKKVALTAKITKMAIVAQYHTNIKLDSDELEGIFDNILNDIKYIVGESAELATNPDYLFWKNRE